MPDYSESPKIWWIGFNMRIVKAKVKGDLDSRYIFEERKQDAMGNESWHKLGEIIYKRGGDTLINTLHSFLDILNRDGLNRYTGPEEIS